MLVDPKLNSEQVSTLKRFGEDFKTWIATDKAKRDIQEHREHERYFKEQLSSENLMKITEHDLAEIWKKTWASRIWVDKDWNFKNKIVAPNGFERIKKELYQLLYATGDFPIRYNRFRENIKGFGIATLSEILNMVFPAKFCLWNDKPKKVLPFLGLDGLPENLLKSTNIPSAEDYMSCVDYTNLVKNELTEFGVKDFIDLDIFFWHIFTDVMPRQSKNLIESKDEFETPKFTDLEDLILAFDKDRNFFGAQTPEEDAMKLQAQFLVDFPPTRISEMNIDDYVIGKIDPNTGENDEHNFCYQLEFGIRGFGGIGGTPATKYGIYCDKKTQKYKYSKDKYDSPESAFKATRSQLEFILNNGKKVIEDKNWSNFAQTLEGDFDIHRHVRSKILSVYYPQFFFADA